MVKGVPMHFHESCLTATQPQTLPLADLARMQEIHRCVHPDHLPNADGWEFAALCRPFEMVGGDYCDVFEVAPGQMAIALGDVSGKGPGGAMVVAVVHSLLHSLLPSRSDDIGGVLRQINQHLLAFTPDYLFVTLFVGILDLSTGDMRYVNAGHLPPIVFTGDTRAEKLVGSGGLLGVVPEMQFEECETSLASGSVMTLFSDGVTETMNEAGEMFGEEGVIECLGGRSDGEAETILAQIVESVVTFGELGTEANRGVHDDISLVVVRCTVDAGANRDQLCRNPEQYHEPRVRVMCDRFQSKDISFVETVTTLGAL